jgi:hypothetical protein
MDALIIELFEKYENKQSPVDSPITTREDESLVGGQVLAPRFTDSNHEVVVQGRKFSGSHPAHFQFTEAVLVPYCWYLVPDQEHCISLH